MEPILQSLDAEWLDIATSPAARRALIRWANTHDELAGLHDLHDVLACRTNPNRCYQVLSALAALAPSDELAARTLLQMLLPGIVKLVGTVGRGNPDAQGELVAIAWDRIRTYPESRRGSVAANVVLDVRKRYLRQAKGRPAVSLQSIPEPASTDRAPEDEVLSVLFLEDLRAVPAAGVVSDATVDAIIRTRVVGERLAAVADDQQVTCKVLGLRRWRAERHLRSLDLAG